MQCPNKHYIYALDKRQLLKDLPEIAGSKDQYGNIIIPKHLLLKTLKERTDYFTGKEWIFYDRKPDKPKQRFLNELGYYKCYTVGCGQCEICRTEHSKEWATKAYCENKMWKNACFITLTYNPQNLPEGRKLRRSDLQQFWKNLRYHLYKDQTKKKGRWRHDKTTGARWYEEYIDMEQEQRQLEEIYTNHQIEMFGPNKRRRNRKPIRYINCGEYGPKTKRPHYHAVIWNFMPNDLVRHYRDRRGYWIYRSKKLTKIWGKGFVIVGNNCTETAAYVARYCTKKYSRTEEEQERMKNKKQLEFIGASSLGFIGYFYWEKWKDTIKTNKGILMKSKDHTFLAKLPKAMCKKWELEDEDGYLDYYEEKCFIGEENWKEILSKQDLPEDEYIENQWKSKMNALRLLKREYDQKPVDTGFSW